MRRQVVSALAMAFAFLAGTTACATSPAARPATGGSPTPATETAAAATPIEVTCDASAGIALSADHVVAAPAGVPVRVSSTGPAGTYLNYSWGGGGGGDPAPTLPTVLYLAARPGTLRLSCSLPETRRASRREREVTVSDPGGYWSPATLADLGCRPGAQPSWAIGPGRGSSASAAVDAMLDLLRTGRGGSAGRALRAAQARIGYRDAPSQTWIVSDGGRPWVTLVVVHDGTAFTAFPDALCAPA